MPSTGPDAGRDAGLSEGPICDGSRSMRLAITRRDGFVASASAFANPYGNTYLFVDGECRYYASVDYMAGFNSGTLTATEAERLAQDIGWERIAMWSSYRDLACPDAGSSVITRMGTAATCICHCQDMGPAGLSDAMQQAFHWAGTLAGGGERSTGPISAIAQAQSQASGHEQSWTLPRPLASIPNLVQGPSARVTTVAHFDASDELAALRSLRVQATLRQLYAEFIQVTDDGVAYLLFARDDLPTAATTAIDALLASVPTASP